MLRDEIGDVLLNFRLLGLTIKDGEDEILAVIAPELEKARKWDRFVGIQSCNDCPACPERPCDDTNCPALKIENALTKEPPAEVAKKMMEVSQ